MVPGKLRVFSGKQVPDPPDEEKRRLGADVLRRINGHPASRLDELLPWNWKGRSARLVA